MDLDSLKRMLEIFEMVSRSKIECKQDGVSEFLEEHSLLDLSKVEGVEL